MAVALRYRCEIRIVTYSRISANIPLTIALILATASTLLPIANAFERAACLGADRIDADHIFAPSPTACEDYILCYEGQQFIDSCPEGHRFNAPTQNCPLANYVDCIGCTRGMGVTRLPHVRNCERYFQCSFGRREELSCPVGLLFDRTVGECNQAEAVDCGEREIPQPEDDEAYEDMNDDQTVQADISVRNGDNEMKIENEIPLSWRRDRIGMENVKPVTADEDLDDAETVI